MNDANEESMLADDEEGNLLYLVMDVVVTGQIEFGQCLCKYGLYSSRGTLNKVDGKGRIGVKQIEGRKNYHAERTRCENRELGIMLQTIKAKLYARFGDLVVLG